jgi:hypothetical protein
MHLVYGKIFVEYTIEVQCVGIWPSHQRDDTIMAGADVDRAT